MNDNLNENKNELLVSKMINEIIETEKILNEWKQCWLQKIEYNDLDYKEEYELNDDLNKGNVTLEEVFNKIEEIYWYAIKSKKSTRSITFSKNGEIEFSKRSNDIFNGLNYDFKYNILKDGFYLKSTIRKDYDKDKLEIAKSNYRTNIKTKELNITYNKEKNRKRINYTSPIIDNSSIAVELWTDENNEIKNCYVDFRTHKNNGKINGIYALRLNPNRYYDKYSIRFISRKGDRYVDFSDRLENSDEEIVSTIVNKKLTPETIDKLIKKIIPIVNTKATRTNQKYISEKNTSTIKNLEDSERKAINFVKLIKAEIPLPHLQDNLAKFITENDKTKNKNKIKVLK